jgi:hypothetical protein
MAQWNNDSILVIGGMNNNNINIDICEWINLNSFKVSSGPRLIQSRRICKTLSINNPNYPGTKMIITIGGATSSLEGISSIEVLELEKPIKPNPPKLLSISKSCSEFLITLEDDNGYESISLVSNETINVFISNLKFIPPNKAEVKLALMDASKKGYFNLKVSDNAGLTYNYKDSLSISGTSALTGSSLNLNINARLIADTIRLTDNNYNYRGSAWLTKKINIADGFSTKFSFKYSGGLNKDCDDKSEPGADGLALVFQNSSINAIGNYGGGIGFDGINNALAFEFDTYQNDSSDIENMNDPDGNHFAVQYSKNRLSSVHKPENNLFITSKIPKLLNDVIYNISIDYNIEPNTLRIFMDSAGKNNKLIASLPKFDFNNYITFNDGKSAYIGFTAGTGCAVANHDVFNWELCSSQRITDVSENAFSDITISPNPASDYIEISLDSPSIKRGLGGVLLEIINIFGEKNPTLALPTGEGTGKVIPIGEDLGGVIRIDISNLAPGVYFIKIGDKFEKFVKY